MKYKKNLKYLILFSLIAVSLVLGIIYGGFQTPVVNVFLSTAGVVVLIYMYRPFTVKQLQTAKLISYLCCFALFIQLLIFRGNDGRPKLCYETNWGAAYLFLFFLYNDILNIKFCKFFVIVASFFILSRLLILSLVSFYVIRFAKYWLKPFRLHWLFVFVVGIISFFCFNYWFLRTQKIDYYTKSTDVKRLTTLNDGSNELRFTINKTILDNIDKDEKLFFGYGDIRKNSEYRKMYHLMPHNELLDSVAEFGFITTFLLALFSFSVFSKYFCWKLYDYYIPIFIYTLILWARFLIVPSPELIFLLLMLKLKNSQYESKGAKRLTYCS